MIFSQTIKKILTGFKSHRGQSLIELLVAIGLSTILIPAILTGMVAARSGRAQESQRTVALGYAKEAMEAVRSIRNKDWATFAAFTAGSAYHPVISGTSWTLASGSEQIGGLTRQVVINNVYRDASGTIVSNGTLDPSLKQVVTTVSWTTPLIASVTQTQYLARFTNKTYQETTTTDFNAGANSGTDVVATSGTAVANDGQVQLGGGGAGDWCNPTKVAVVKYDLPGQGVTTAISATYSASAVHLYTTTGYNASGHSTDGVLVSDPQSGSPVASSGGFYDNFKTYGIFATANNVFLASNHPNLTVDVINATSPYSQKATFADSGREAGTGVYVSGNTGYVTAGSNLYAFDTTTISGSLAQKWVVALAGAGNRVIVNGNYAYVVTSYNSSGNPKGQLQIIDTTTHSVITTIDTGNGADGTDVYINSSATYAYLVTKYAVGKSNFFIYDISSKTNPVLHGTYSTGGMNPTGVTAVSGNHALIVGTGGQPYQVLDTVNIDNPVSCLPQGFSLSGVININAIAALAEPDGDAFSYILTDDASNELQIIAGGAGGQGGMSGTFESKTFDASSEAMFNNFSADITLPLQSTLQYKIAVKPGVNQSCNSVSFANGDFVGSDGTSNTYLATSSALPVLNPGRCMRYRAYLTTADPTLTPVLYDILFNYSP